MLTLILATRNAHKAAEIRAMLPPEVRLLSLGDFPGAPPVVEDRATFEGNALKKASELACWLATQHETLRAVAKEAVSDAVWVMADDSGLEVDALGGAPGVHSARFAALDSGAPGNSPDAANNAKLLRLLDVVPDAARTARFRCVIALAPVWSERNGRRAAPDCEEIERGARCFSGACEGCIQRTPSGGGGFGYDPLFIPEGFTCSFAEIGEEAKNRISHRGRAMLGLKEALGRNGLRAGASPAVEPVAPGA